MARVAVVERVSERAHQVPLGSRIGIAAMVLGVAVDLVPPGHGSRARPRRRDLPWSHRCAAEDITVQVGTTVRWTNNDNCTWPICLLDNRELHMVTTGQGRRSPLHHPVPLPIRLLAAPEGYARKCAGRLGAGKPSAEPPEDGHPRCRIAHPVTNE